MAETWVPLRQYAEARGVTSDAVLKAIRRGRLGVPHRRSNSDGRGSYEILMDLDGSVPPAPPVSDRSATAATPAPLAEIEALRGHLAAVEAERDRALAERDQERQRLDAAQRDHAADLRRLQAQLESLSGRLGELAKEAARAGAAEAERDNARAELERLRGRSWFARLLDL